MSCCSSYHPLVRYVFLIWVIVELWTLSGLMFGWGALVFVLKDEGFFVDDYKQDTMNETIRNCVERDETFNLYFALITAIGSVLMLAFGWTFRTYGTRKARILSSCGLIAGCIIMAFAETETAWMLCVGGILIMTSGLALYLTAFQISVLFPTRKSLIHGIVNGTYDSSSAVFLLVKELYNTYGISRKVSFIALVCLAGSTLISTFVFFPKMHIEVLSTKHEAYLDHTIEVPVTDKKAKHYDTVPELGNSTDQRTMSIKQRIFSSLYCTHVIWFVVCYFQYIYFIGTLNNTLNRITDENKDAVSYYTNIVSIAMFCGVISSTLAGFVYDLQRRLFQNTTDKYNRCQMSAIIPLCVTSMLATLLSILAFVNNELVIYASAITVVLLRSLLFAVMSVYIADTFPARDLGLLMPIGIVVGIGFGMLQYAYFRWSNSYDGAISHVNITITIMCIMSFIHPANVYWRVWRKQPTAQSPHRDDIKDGTMTNTSDNECNTCPLNRTDKTVN